MNQPLKISVVIPAYNMEKTIRETIASVLHQTYYNFEIIVQDNDSIDNTAAIVKSFSDQRIKYFKNDYNVGYARNLIEGWKNCRGDILYFLGADDILSKYALEKTSIAFLKNNNIGVVTRPYYWFQDKIDMPIRVTPKINSNEGEITIYDFEKASLLLHNEILGQLSGLAFRMKYLKYDFFTKENDWIAHGYPFINIFKKYPAIFLKKYQIAVRIGSNIIRQKGTSAYNISPTKRWVDMINNLLCEEEFQKFKEYFIKKIIASNYLGLIQIRCFSSFKFLLREIYYLIKYKWLNIFNIKFWFFSIGCMLIPSAVLVKLVDYYKNRINSRLIEDIDFDYDISND